MDSNPDFPATHSAPSMINKLNFQVVLPYFKSKLHSIYNKEREARLQASLWGDDNEGFNDAEIYEVRGDHVVPTRTLGVETSLRARVMKKFQKIVGSCYPWLHASSEGNKYTGSSSFYCIFLF